MRLRPALPALLLAAALAAGGCESREANALRTARPGQAAAEGEPRLDVAFYGKVSRKSGKRSGESRTFTVADKARVYAFADFANLEADRDYTVHLAWIRPDGREMFRRFAEFRITVADSGCGADIRWLDAVNLNDIEHEHQAVAGPGVSLDSTLNIDPDKGREPGEYRFRVYLDRRLVREEPFTILAGAPQEG